MNEFAFVFGNGQTRLDFNTRTLSSYGKIFGCNRMYTDPNVDVIISVDPGPTRLIQEHPGTYEHYTRPQYTNNISFPCDKRYQGYSSGPNAVAIAAGKGFPYIFLIGMDLTSNTGFHNNIYAGTEFYKSDTEPPTYYGNWVSQISHIAENYSHIRLIHVNPLSGFTPTEWRQMSNFSIMTKIEFLTFVGIDK